jgi:hypothetical protein
MTKGLAVVLSAALMTAAFVESTGQSVSAQAKPKADPGSSVSRTPDGQPDIQGVWAGNMCRANAPCPPTSLEAITYLKAFGFPQRQGLVTSRAGAPATTVTRSEDASAIVDPLDHILPYQPWAKARRDALMPHHLRPSRAEIDTNSNGWPTGIPRENYYSSPDGSVGGPIQIFQPRGFVVFFYETHHEFRIVPLDGRPHVGQEIKLWEGDSRGRWEGNTLVVDVTNSNDSTRFSLVGDFHTDTMRITERWTFADRNTIDYRATIDDPKVYTRPWTVAVKFTRTQPGTELIEYAGVEGERSIGNLLPKTPAADAR